MNEHFGRIQKLMSKYRSPQLLSFVQTMRTFVYMVRVLHLFRQSTEVQSQKEFSGVKGRFVSFVFILPSLSLSISLHRGSWVSQDRSGNQLCRWTSSSGNKPALLDPLSCGSSRCSTFPCYCSPCGAKLELSSPDSVQPWSP